jgi:glycosyltransferase involved in cell wall biosynthesis
VSDVQRNSDGARLGGVSVVIPAWNAAPTIARAVRSAAAQSPRPVEVIVVDDASGDGTGEVAAAAAPGVRVVGGAGQGVGPARNIGIREATGAWVGFLDADDRWEPGLLAAAIDAIEAQQGAVACFVAATPVDDDDRVIGRHDVTPMVSFEDLFLGRIVPTTSATLVSRKAILDAGGFFDGFAARAGVEDFDLWLRIARQGPCVGVPAPLATYVVHDERDRRRTRAALLDLERDRELAMTRIAEHGMNGPLFRRGLAIKRARTGRYWLRAGHKADARRVAAASLRARPTFEGALMLAVALLPEAVIECLRRLHRRWRSRSVGASW